MKIQCLHFCRKNFFKWIKKSPYPPLKVHCSWMTHELPRRCNKLTCQTCQPVALVLLAQTQDALIPGRATAVTPQGNVYRWGWRGPATWLSMDFPLFLSLSTPHVMPVWESGWGSWRPPRSLRRETVSTSVLQDALHLEMWCSGSTVKQSGFKVKQPYLFVSVSIL